MAYKGSLMVTDDLLLQGLQKCKSLGALAMVHAENGDAVAEGQQRMIDLGITGPEGHALSRPPIVIQVFIVLKNFCTSLTWSYWKSQIILFSYSPQLEGEATARAIRLAKFINTPLYVVHVMSIDAMEEIAKAKREGELPETFSSTIWFVSTLEPYQSSYSQMELLVSEVAWFLVTSWGLRTGWFYILSCTEYRARLTK